MIAVAFRAASMALFGARRWKLEASMVQVSRAKGGWARAQALSPERRAEIAKKAAAARWGNKKMKGRKPKPQAAKDLAGNPGRRKAGKAVAPPVEVPDCPPHLKGEARAEWKRISTELLQMGVIARIDRSALAMYCMAWSRWVAAEAVLENEGPVLTGAQGGTYQNPQLSVANGAMEQMRKILVEFGMTPSSRSRVHARGAEKEVDPLENLLQERAANRANPNIVN